MLRWAIIFLIIAIVAALFGFVGVEGIAFTAAKWLFIAFIILFLVSLIFGWRGRRDIL